MRVDTRQFYVGFELWPGFLINIINVSSVAALCWTDLASKKKNFLTSRDCDVIFEFDGFAFTQVIELLPGIVIIATVFGKIDSMEVAENSFVYIVASVDVHILSLDDGSVVWPVRNVFSRDFDLSPSAIEGVEILGFDG